MKRLLFSFLFVLTAIAGWAQEPTTFTVGNFKYTVTDDENHYVSIAKADEATFNSALVIPSSVVYETVTYTVTSVGASGFCETGITSVTIPASVTSVGDAAFQCGSITSITIEDSETPLTMPGTWYERPLNNSASIIYIGRDLTLTGGENHPLTYGATSVEFGPQVTTINPALFYSNTKLASIIIGNGVTTIGESAFYSCGQDEGVTETVVSMGSNVTSIGANAFRDCNKLKSVTLPSKLTTIGNEAFNGSSLTSISIPASVTSVGVAAFQGCSSMTSITIEDSETPLTMPGTWYERPLNNSASIIYIGRDLTLTGGENHPLTYGATSVEFGPQVTTINPALFYSNTKLASIIIGNGVTTIGESAFYSCGQDEGVTETVVSMGSNVTSIGANAFRDCNKLKSVTLPSKLTTIGNEAFNGSSLTSISIPASVTSVGVAAFQGCSSMTSIRIEDSGTALTMAGTYYERPFWNDASTIYIGRNLKLTGEGVIASLNDAATSVEFGSPVTAISAPISGVLTSVKVPWLTPITIDEGIFNDTELKNATLWVPGGTMDAYEAADNWKEFAHKDFASFVVSITGSAHGTLAVGEIESTGGVEETTLIDRGEDAVFTVTPATGYELTTFTVNGGDETPTEGSYTVEDLSADQTVVAGFTPITYNLTYTLNGGTATNPATYTIETETFTLNNPTKTGYDFAGWKLNGVGEAMMTVTIAQGSTGHLAYTATWTPTVYNIVYTMDGGTATPANPTTYTIETESFTLNNPTKTGHTFKGWKQNGEGDAMMEVTIAQGSTGHLAYTATWQVNKYTITFDSNEGSAVDPITQDYGTTVTAPDDPTKTGYDFAGWTPALPATMPAENIAVTANWTVKTYTVSITGTGVTADNMNPKYGDDVVINIAADEDRTLNTLTVNNVDVTAQVVNNQYTIHNVSSNITVVATFNSTKEYITLAQGVGTFSCSQDLNFTGSELKAYIAAGYNKGESQVLLVRVYDVPAGTGIYLKGEADVTYKIPYSTSQAYYVNMLKANLTASSIAKTSGDMSNFLLNKVGGEYGFFAPSETATLGAQQAYLQVPTSFMSGSGEARAISIAFEEDGTTNISDFKLFTNSNEHLYNLKGQRVEKAGRGLYIKNGKKVVIK